MQKLTKKSSVKINGYTDKKSRDLVLDINALI